jgi:polyphosphate glucokinase
MQHPGSQAISTSSSILLGIDLGGSAIKAAPVDVATGSLMATVLSLSTPQPATPGGVAVRLEELAAAFPGVTGPIGFAFPSVVKSGIACTAANVDQAWLGCNGAAVVREATGRDAVFLNDADAAGLAELRFGAGRGAAGTVIVLTFGTGIGSALFVDGHLLPNTEFGHLEIRGMEAEHRASARVLTAERLSWPEWTGRVNEYLARMEALLWPDLWIIAGGVTERWAEFGALLRSRARLVPAALRQSAGVVGAALAAHDLLSTSRC